MNPFLYYRKLRGLPQRDVAGKLGVSSVSVLQWEKGQTYPQAGRLLQLADIYQCPVEDLLKPTLDLPDESEAIVTADEGD